MNMDFWRYFFGNFFNFIRGFFSKFLVGVQFVFLSVFVIKFTNYVGAGAITELIATGKGEDFVADVLFVNYCLGIFLSCITSILFGLTISELIGRIYRCEPFNYMMNLRTKKDVETFLVLKHPFVYVVNFLVPMATIGLIIYLTTYTTFFKCLLGFLAYAFGHVVLFSYAMYIYHSEETKLEVLEKLQGDDFWWKVF